MTTDKRFEDAYNVTVMGQALYRKYRSRSLDEVIGQEHVTTTLENALKSGALSHAYLFTGPKGVGKTSIARILAHRINQLDYTGEDTYLDIIEIDAASNRGIDEIRDLREKVAIAPSQGKFKVYIIDEVHMLTTPAFNALLKTLEEPPAHVVFILATTEVHKLPETIISRTQRHTFRPVEPAKVIAHLRHIADEEKIKVTDEALGLIAAHGEGSFRDSISLLDQAASRGEKITDETIRDVLGIPSETGLRELLTSVYHGDSTAIVSLLSRLTTQGYQASAIAKQLGQLIRTDVLADTSTGPSREELLDLLARLIDVPASAEPERLLEIVLLRAALPRSDTTTPVNSAKTVKATTAKAPSQQASPAEAKSSQIADKPEVSSRVEESPKSTKPAANPKLNTGTDVDITNVWPGVLDALKSKHNTIYGILRLAQPQLDGDHLTLAFQYAFHQKRIQEAKNRQIIATILEELTGAKLTIECVKGETGAPAKSPPVEDEVVTSLSPKPATNDTSSLTNVSNIFGGAELLES